eukprot:scaffold7092_cov262-Pinguiococcus_pyrenoidosus.AAC.14
MEEGPRAKLVQPEAKLLVPIVLSAGLKAQQELCAVFMVALLRHLRRRDALGGSRRGAGAMLKEIAHGVHVASERSVVQSGEPMSVFLFGVRARLKQQLQARELSVPHT